LKLSEVKYIETVIITKILGHGSFRKRISEMGFVKGKEIKVIKNAPFNGPFEFKILDYNVSLRKSEADLIEVVPVTEFIGDLNGSYKGVIDIESNLFTRKGNSRVINVALVGNPNCGKTTLFNFISHSKEKVGNYTGVTVDIKKAEFETQGYKINFYDLPGTYSLTAYSEEEIFVRRFIYEKTPDIVINVIDSGNLERSLFLTTQLIDMDLRIVAALNMYDELERKKIEFNYKELSKLTGLPFVPTISLRGTGINELLEKVIEVFEGGDEFTRHIHINYGNDIEESIQKIREKIKEDKPITDKISSRFLAIKMLEKDTHVRGLLSQYKNFNDIEKTTVKEIGRIESLFDDTSETIITNAKYGFISGALRETFKNPFREEKTNSEKIDYFLTNKYLGFPIFAAILFIMFYATFSLGSYPMRWIDNGVALINNSISSIMPEGSLKDLITGGIINGAGSVLVFLPNILILFLFISILEESGYMARAAFIMDKIMHRFGLHGRSFIPLIMGFGCNVPAILATRTMRNRNDRLLTMLIIPFMSCSARLPVYILIISAFFTNSQALILTGLYAAGILFAFLTAQILNKTLFRRKETPFVMELPPYRIPTFRIIVFHMWDKTRHYLKKIGTIILIGVIIIWALGYFPRDPEDKSFINNKEYLTDNSADTKNHLNAMEDASNIQALQLSNSYLGRIGRFIQPVMAPLGFDWKMTISLIAGLPAKEIIVSTMGVLYQSDDNGSSVNLQEKLNNEIHMSGKHKGKKVFNTGAALAFLIFILIYFPCIGVIATINNEAGSWKWGLFVIVYTTSLAWISAFLVYNITSLFIGS
jgi:ferrous iron transport protein B